MAEKENEVRPNCSGKSKVANTHFLQHGHGHMHHEVAVNAYGIAYLLFVIIDSFVYFAIW